MEQIALHYHEMSDAWIRFLADKIHFKRAFESLIFLAAG